MCFNASTFVWPRVRMKMLLKDVFYLAIQAVKNETNLSQNIRPSQAQPFVCYLSNLIVF